MLKNICDVYNIETTKQARLHKPVPITEIREVKVLWDFEIRTDHRLPARRPDIVVLDKETRTVQTIDVAVPADGNIKKKELEKMQKYKDLRLEIQKM